MRERVCACVCYNEEKELPAGKKRKSIIQRESIIRYRVEPKEVKSKRKGKKKRYSGRENLTAEDETDGGRGGETPGKRGNEKGDCIGQEREIGKILQSEFIVRISCCIHFWGKASIKKCQNHFSFSQSNFTRNLLVHTTVGWKIQRLTNMLPKNKTYAFFNMAIIVFYTLLPSA